MESSFISVIQLKLDSTQLNSNHCLHVNGSFAQIPVTHAVCSGSPPYHDRPLLLYRSLVKVWMIPLVFGIESLMSVFPRTRWNGDSDHSTHFHCLSNYLRWALAQRTKNIKLTRLNSANAIFHLLVLYFTCWDRYAFFSNKSKIALF